MRSANTFLRITILITGSPPISWRKPNGWRRNSASNCRPNNPPVQNNTCPNCDQQLVGYSRYCPTAAEEGTPGCRDTKPPWCRPVALIRRPDLVHNEHRWPLIVVHVQKAGGVPRCRKKPAQTQRPCWLRPG